MANTIKLKKYLDVIREALANSAIIPGMLLELMSTGRVRPHADDRGNVCPIMFALEDELQGKDIEDAYAAGETVQVWVAQRGEEVNALLADGENAAIGSKLVSNADGYLKVHANDSMAVEEIVGIALEAVDRSSSSGGDTNTTGRIKVLVI